MKLLVTNQINNTSSVTVTSDGNFNLNFLAEQITRLAASKTAGG